jgi:uncharacterized protein (TIGR01777 family)
MSQLPKPDKIKAVIVLIAGGSGFLGQKLAGRLASDGHEVRILTRQTSTDPKRLTWHPDGTPGDLPQRLAGIDAVVNLAGENVSEGRWTEARKAALASSRILSTRTIAGAITRSARPPRVLVNASGVGYYGPHGDEPVTEATPHGSDFFGRLCVDWEGEARAAAPAARVAMVRSGIALAADGGALKKMLLPFKLGLGATVGSGQQYLPWIHVDDWTALVTWLITTDSASGAFNATAPGSTTNHEFTRALGRVLGRPAFLRAPAFAMRLALGEMADMLLTGQRALPACAERAGFQFSYPTLEPALRSLPL